MCVVFITASNIKEARKISKTIVEDKLAACVNSVSGIESRYWWKGKVEQAAESLLIVKTRKSFLPRLIRKVKEIHSYSVPEVIALPIVGGSPDYLRWIQKTIS